jgi:hypothetical protein
MRERWRRTGIAVGLVLVMGCALAGCSAGEKQAESTAAKPAPPPPPPETSLGRLVKVERAESAPILARCYKSAMDNFLGTVVAGKTPEGGADAFELRKRGASEMYHAKRGFEVYVMLEGAMGQRPGVCPTVEKAGAGKTFLVLQFEGKAGRSTNEEADMAKFVGVGATRVLARVDSHSWLTDGAGKKYPSPAVVVGAEKRQLAFEIPADAAGLAWHDRKDEYRLEPAPAKVTPPPAAPSSGAK